MLKDKKWKLSKTDPKNYGPYSFILIIIGYLTTKIGGLLGIFGRILMVLGVVYFFMWAWYQLKKNRVKK